jgi:hypothetical protein
MITPDLCEKRESRDISEVCGEVVAAIVTLPDYDASGVMSVCAEHGKEAEAEGQEVEWL